MPASRPNREEPPSERQFERLVETLHHGGMWDRLIAMYKLAELRDPRAVPHLTPFLRIGIEERLRLRRGSRRDIEKLTDNKLTKQTAMNSLSAISHPDAIPHVAKLLDYPDNVVQQKAAVTLMDIFEAAKKKQLHADHQAINAMRAIAPHISFNEGGYPKAQYYRLLKKALELAMRKPHRFKDAATTRKTMYALHEKHVKPKKVVAPF